MTAIVIALLVLFLGVRPLGKALLKKPDAAIDPAARLAMRADGTPADGGVDEDGQVVMPAAPVSIGALESAVNYDDRIGMVRGFTRDNPARAALAVRDMIKADAKS